MPYSKAPSACFYRSSRRSCFQTFRLQVEILEDRTLPSNIAIVPFWDGERSDPSGRLLNYFGGNPLQLGGHATAAFTSAGVHSGTGAYQITPNNGTIPVNNFDFLTDALTGQHADAPGGGAYLDTRDLTPFGAVNFWVRNATGAPFTLVFEIKDYRDRNDQRAQHAAVIGAGSSWVQLNAPLDLTPANGWVVTGNPDLTRARFFSLVIQADRGAAVSGSFYVDDMVLIERAGPLDSATAPVEGLMDRIAHRQFNGLYGSRDAPTGLIPNLSSFADQMAVNSTGGLIKLLPTAVQLGWIGSTQANSYVGQVVATLQTVFDRVQATGNGGRLPPRYIDRVTLLPASGEESPVDAAILFLALYQYKSLPGTPAALRTATENLLNRFNFADFGLPGQGWSRKYDYTSRAFDTGTYDGYSGEVWLISLAAHLSQTHAVDITTFYHTGTLRTRAALITGNPMYLVHTLSDFRAAFVQWLFPLFVDVSGRGVDSYSLDPSLASNPLDNAILYEKDVTAFFTNQGRNLKRPKDAADDGTGTFYRQFSAFNDFGEPDLFMPWSLGFSLLGDLANAEAAFRFQLASNLDGPLGLVDTVTWPNNQAAPTRTAARVDFWNQALCAMALVQRCYPGNQFLSSLPEVRSALDKVFTGTLHFDGLNFTGVEGGTATITVSRTGGTAGTVSGNFATSDGTARAGTDYTAVAQPLSFGPGITSLPVVIPLLEDPVTEGNETVRLTVTTASVGVLGLTADSSRLTIRDNDNQDNVRFVATLYQELLQRLADSGGLTHWTGLLALGRSRTEVAQGIWESAEHRGLQVDQFYSTLLGRPSDLNGRRHWIDQFVTSKKTEFDVQKGFLTSLEFLQRHASTNDGLVAGFYNAVLLREPDCGGKVFWVSLLQAGQSTPDQVAEAFLTSAENRRRIIIDDYWQILGRLADQSGFQNWDMILAKTRSPTLVGAGIFGSQESFARV